MDEFVGRSVERARFAELASSPEGAVVVVHGPGGIGKTALLDALTSDARALGFHVVAMDDLPEPGAIVGDQARRTLIVVDDGEPALAALRRLRTSWTSGMPPDSIALVASRTAPPRRRPAGPGWPSRVEVFPLGDLTPDEAEAFVHAADIPAEYHKQVLRFGLGNPLALSALADLARQSPEDLPVHSIEENMTLVGALLDEIVEPVPTGRHRRALQVCAHVRFTTEDLLSAALPGDVQELFEWLRHRPFISQAARGLVPSPIVRSVVEADLRWRDRAMFQALDRSLMRTLMARTVRPAPDLEGAFLAAVDALYLRPTHSPTLFGLTEPADWAFFDTATFERYEASTEPELQAATPAHEWPWIASLIEASEDASAVFREGGGPIVAFGSRRRFTQRALGAARDEAAAALRLHSEAYGPARDGETLALTQVVPLRPDLDAQAAVFAIGWLALAAQYERAATWEGVVMPAYPAWREALAYFDFHPVTELRDGLALYAHDWRRLDVPGLVRMFVEQPWDPIPREPTGVAGPVFLTESEFAEAIRQAMRDLAYDSRLADNPLMDSRIVRTAESGLTPERQLRALIREEASSLREEHPQLYRILDSTYLRPSATQEQIAERLGLAFTTYRRRRNRAVARVADALWAKEIGSRRD